VPAHPLSIVHGPANVGNLPWVLSGEMRKLGHRSEVVVNFDTWLGYPVDKILGKHGDRSWGNVARRFANAVSQPITKDVLHCYFGRSFMSWDDLGNLNRWPLSDLQLARRLGRRVVMTYQGCDARLAGESNRRNAVTMCRPDGCSAYASCITSIDARRQANVSRIDQLADLVLFVNPELGHFLPRGSFFPYGNVDVEAIRPAPTPLRERPLILHAPSDPTIKGTRQITEALDTLRGEFDFDLRLVQGLPHEQAMALYRDADLLIDQVLAGWYGGLAVELMAMGKPVACYLRDEDLSFVPAAMRGDLPLYRIDERTLVNDLRALLSRRAEWGEAGRRSRDFVMRWHHPGKLAQVLLRSYAEPARYDEFIGEMR
jgi:hypothetical protein